MRAFIGQFDRVSSEIFLLGAATGVVWLVAVDLGVLVAALAIVIGSVALIIHHRWIEIGLLMVGIGLVAQVGYWIFGEPPEPPLVFDPISGWYVPLATEVFAPGMAGLLLIGGAIFTLVIGIWEMREGRRRERLDRRHRERRARQIADLPEG
jgi:Na+/phosphate symporter